MAIPRQPRRLPARLSLNQRTIETCLQPLSCRAVDLLGVITGLPNETTQIPWDGPRVRIIEHKAHASGHAALLIEERAVLVAGDVLSDVLIPMLDSSGSADPIEDYLAALRLLEGVHRWS